MITFDDVTFIYDGKPLIEHFSYSVKEGEKAVLFGPSGQGKSTLLTSIAGFIRPSRNHKSYGISGSSASH